MDPFFLRLCSAGNRANKEKIGIIFFLLLLNVLYNTFIREEILQKDLTDKSTVLKKCAESDRTVGSRVLK